MGLSWYGSASFGPDRPGSEAVVQALSGLMHVHGRDAGKPRRIGLEVASVTAGILAAQAVLAAAVGRRRGARISAIETSVLQAGLLLVSHRVAAATAGRDWVPAADGPAPGPPFATRDGYWVEIETLDPEAWKRFWVRLGAAHANLGWAWSLFRPRYFRGTCSLPPGLHEATTTHTLAEVLEAARACQVSAFPVRCYEDVLESSCPSDGFPRLSRLPAAGVPRRRVPTSPPELPLTGLRVVEATSRVQGPLAGLLLQMLGAEVLKVEPPGGDPSRAVPPLAGETGSFFLSFNRGKRTVELDLGRPNGRDELVDLVAHADVFLHNWRPGKAVEWGLDPPALARANSGLVYCEASGWGASPDAPRLVGTDFLVQAYAGVGAGITPEDEPPFPSRALLADCAGGLVTCEGILRGLYEREVQGGTWVVDASLLAGAMSLQAHVLEALMSGEERGRRAGRPLWGPLDHPVEAADGFVVVDVDDDDALHRLCDACGVDQGGESRGEVEAAVVRRLATGRARHWTAALEAAGLPCAVVCSDLSALPADSGLAGLFEPVAACRAAASPWRFSP